MSSSTTTSPDGSAFAPLDIGMIAVHPEWVYALTLDGTLYRMRHNGNYWERLSGPREQEVLRGD